MAAWIRPRIPDAASFRILDLSLCAMLAAIAVQLVPLPSALVSIVSPARVSYARATALDSQIPSLLPLTLDRAATMHALLAACSAIAAFWCARTVFSRGGVRTVLTGLAWTAVAFVIVAFAQGVAGTELVYGFWRPREAGARPLGPFVNRNHAGTWSLLALFLCLGCLQWRRASAAPPRAWSWRARLAHALNGRALILGLAISLLVVCIAVGASRSTMLALACAAGYVALAAPRTVETRRSSLLAGAVALSAAFAVLAYADLDRVFSRVGETRQLGLAQRAAIWRDALRVIGDFPLAGAGAGNFSNVMKVYQTSDRTYFWNEAHNHYLQILAEGGMLLAIPCGIALAAFTRTAVMAARRRDDPVHWLRLGASAALLAVALQAIWETGLTLPANAMLAAAAAAILVHTPRHGSHAPAGD